MINAIISEKLYDAQFVADNTDGFSTLKERVAGFTPSTLPIVPALLPMI